MGTICNINGDEIWGGSTASISDAAPCPPGWVRAIPPVGSGVFQWDGETWTALTADQIATLAAIRAKQQVPISVSMRQARLVMLATPAPAPTTGTLLDVVTAYIAAQPQATQIEWDYATDVWRTRDLVVGIGTALGLNDDQIDALFVAAAAIP